MILYFGNIHTKCFPHLFVNNKIQKCINVICAGAKVPTPCSNLLKSQHSSLSRALPPINLNQLNSDRVLENICISLYISLWNQSFLPNFTESVSWVFNLLRLCLYLTVRAPTLLLATSDVECWKTSFWHIFHFMCFFARSTKWIWQGCALQLCTLVCLMCVKWKLESWNSISIFLGRFHFQFDNKLLELESRNLSGMENKKGEILFYFLPFFKFLINLRMRQTQCWQCGLQDLGSVIRTTLTANLYEGTRKDGWKTEVGVTTGASWQLSLTTT